MSPDHPVADPHRSGGDQARRLVLYLTHTHTHTDAFLLDGDTVEHAALRPHGLWGSDQSLRHRHDGDIAGQRAPLDHAYLDRVVGVVTLDQAHPSEGALLALAREPFGNLPGSDSSRA